MSTLFASLAGLARSTVETVHGEAATILPMDREAGPNGRRGPSLSRLAYAVIAVEYREAESVQRDMAASGMRLGQNGGVLRAGRHTASIRVPDGEIPPREGDMIRFEADGRTYEIGPVDPDGLGHLTLTLSAARMAQ